MEAHKEHLLPKYIGQTPRHMSKLEAEGFKEIERSLNICPSYRISDRAQDIISRGKGLINDPTARAIVEFFERRPERNWSSEDIVKLMLIGAKDGKEYRNINRLGGILPYFLYELFEDGILTTEEKEVKKIS